MLFSIFSLGRDVYQQETERRPIKCLLHISCHNIIIANSNNWGYIVNFSFLRAPSLNFFLLLYGFFIIEKLINSLYSIVNENMEDEPLDFDDNISKMFTGKKGTMTSDEELALHIIHRFNICRDTLETMPAFEKHLEPLFSKVKEK